MASIFYISRIMEISAGVKTAARGIRFAAPNMVQDRICAARAAKIGFSQLDACPDPCRIAREPGGAMIQHIHESRMGLRLSVMGILIGCLVFWTVFALLIVNW